MALLKDEIIFNAKAIDLKSFLEGEGFTFVKESVYTYRCKEEHTLVLTYKFNNPLYFWHRKGQKGNIVDYVMQNITENNFRSAIDYILKDGINRTRLTPYYEEKLVETKNTSLNIKYSSDMKHMYAYLCKTRGIDSYILKELINKGLLWEDQRHNALFLHLNENNEMVGADITGTNSSIKFKGVVKGSNQKYGFSIKAGNEFAFKKLIVFEAPIDAISYFQMNQSDLNGSILLSTGGSSKINTVIKTYLNIYKSIESIYVCSDNDCAGNEVYININELYKNYNIVDGREKLLCANVKDFNDLLLKKY